MPSIKDMAKGATIQQAELIVKDTKYIPEEKFAFCPMGCAKTAARILAECVTVNLEIAASIKGEALGESGVELAARIEQASTIEALGVLVRESAKIVCDAIDTISEADLDKQLKMPWGASFPAWQAILLPVSHMTYHDGQINYIQLLLGDTKFHWLEDAV